MTDQTPILSGRNLVKRYGRVVALDHGGVAYEGSVEDFWRLPERAESLGVDVPRVASLARAVERLAVRNLPTLPDEAALVAALTAAQTTRHS